jgi:hypothetical protein
LRLFGAGSAAATATGAGLRVAIFGFGGAENPNNELICLLFDVYVDFPLFRRGCVDIQVS